MKRLTLILAILALTGCETCKQHPLACTVIVTSATLCAGAVLANDITHFTRPYNVTTQPVSCQNGSCK